MRMRYFTTPAVLIVVGCLTTLSLVACARRPLVDNSTGYTTSQLVDKIRCEMGYAAFWTTKLELTGRDTNYLLSSAERDTLEVGLQLFAEQKSKVTPRLRKLLSIFGDTAVVYDFEFDITVRNQVGGSLGWNDPFGRNLLTGAVGASADQKRRNKRNFRVEETYRYLFEHLPEGCTDPAQVAEWDRMLRRPYPITNALGLRETAETFWKIYQTKALGAAPGTITSSKDKKNEYARIVDEIQYTTKLEGTVGTEATFGPVGDRLRLTPITASTTNSREDIHTLIIAIGIAPKGKIGEAIANAREGVDDRIQRNGLKALARLDDREDR